MRRAFPPAAALLVALLLLLTAGCQILGVAASKLPEPTIPAAYDDLAGRPTAVWVWVDPGADIDYPTLSLQIATRLQRNLEAARDTGSGAQKRTLASTTFPVPPASMAKYQIREPILAAMDMTQIAPRLGVERVIYVEVSSFTTQGGAAAGLYRGVANMNVSLLEVTPPGGGSTVATTGGARYGTAAVAYQDQNLSVVFPKRGPVEGSTSLDPNAAYEGLVREIADVAARRFVPHVLEEY